MLLGGLWHGAAWTFVIWGGIHGAGLAMERWWGDRRKTLTLPRADRDAAGGPLPPGGGTAVPVASTQPIAPAPRMPAFIRGLITFHIVTFAWVFFRAP